MTQPVPLPRYRDAAAAIAALQPEEPLIGLRPAAVTAQASRLVAGFPGRVFYAVKANPHPAVLEAVMAGGITAFDTASPDEIRHVRGHAPSALIGYMNPVKPRGSLGEMIARHDVRCLSLDSGDELRKIADEAGDLSALTLLVRILPHVPGALWSMSEKFGASDSDAVALLRAIAATGARPGICFHVGSLNLSPSAWTAALRQAGAIATEAGVRVGVIDVGGGLPAAYAGIDPPPLDDYLNAIHAGLTAVPRAAGGEVWCEIGRAIAAPGGSVVVRVVGRRGMRLFLNDGFYGSLTSPGPPPPAFGLPFRLLPAGPRVAAPAAFELYGPTCDGTDRLPGRFELPADVGEGDYIEFGQHGAYGTCLATRFNGFDRHLTVMLDDPPLLETPGYTSRTDLFAGET